MSWPAGRCVSFTLHLPNFKIGAFLTLELSLEALLIFVSVSLIAQRLQQRDRLLADVAASSAAGESSGG